jgi:methanogenic corrinoid protein MtbC1
VSTTGGPLDDYFKTVASVDAAEASRIVLGMLDEGTSVERITTEVLAPAQVRVGELWQQGRWTVADEHAATAVTETALSALTTATSRPRSPQARHVVVACAEGDWHTLPARMAASVGASGDTRVTVLGPSVRADDLGRRLAADTVDLLALSCTLPANLLGAARCVQAAHDAGVPVLAGGRAFGRTSHRAHAIGADAWAEHPGALLEPTPALTGRETRIPGEVVLLDAVDDACVELAYDRLLAAYPRLQAMRVYEQRRTREDLRWMARFTAAAVLTDDDTVLDDYLGWLCGVLEGRVSAEVITTSAQVVADTVEPFAATGARLLREATDRLQDSGSA